MAKFNSSNQTGGKMSTTETRRTKSERERFPEMTNDEKMRRAELSERQVVLLKSTRFIWWLTGVAEGLIGLRVLLRMMAANPGNAFANFIYRLTDLFLWPFIGLTATPSSDGIVLDIPAVIAMVVYLLLAWVVIELLWLILGRERV
jgi:hypothetical protein